MKRFLVLLLSVSMVLTASSQIVEQGESALVYYSPKTEVVLHFSYTIETQEAGIYASYAEEFLGNTDFIEESNVRYTITDVSIGTRTIADLNRPHKVRADAGIPLLLSINDKGILKGYNLPLEKAKSHKKMHPQKNEMQEISIHALPISEDMLKASDSTEMASLIAQQIYHLREMRMYLLNGEVERLPADGKSMELVLNKLDEQEQALTELFVGKKTIQTKHIEYTIPADSLEQKFYFSAENGFTNSDNIDADTIFVRSIVQSQTYAAPKVEPDSASKTKKKKSKEEPIAPELSPIVYNLPGSADIKVMYSHRIIAQKTIPYAQAGIDVALPKSMFTGDTLPTIVFNEKTGNIVSIVK